MSDEKIQTQSGKPQAAAEAADTEEGAFAQLQADLERFRDLALRSQADFDNYRKRSAREKEDAVKYANSSLLERLIPIIDNFELGLAAAGSAENSPILAGMSMVAQAIERFPRRVRRHRHRRHRPDLRSQPARSHRPGAQPQGPRGQGHPPGPQGLQAQGPAAPPGKRHRFKGKAEIDSNRAENYSQSDLVLTPEFIRHLRFSVHSARLCIFPDSLQPLHGRDQTRLLRSS